ncbi:MAG: M15 family metallopeptidase [Ramlibacter sp.]|nr:M15 family metallopeptidase [Ramlibacter sp.]
MAGTTSRRVEDLTPGAALKCRAMVAACQLEGIDLLVYCTYRDADAQDALYAQGRTAPGPVVTWARGGESDHQSRTAFDCVPLVGGKAVWNDPALWARVGQIGESVGLSWAGRWPGAKREMPHFADKG